MLQELPDAADPCAANAKPTGSTFEDQKARNKKVASERSAAAGCGDKNRCGRTPYGHPAYQCDEFPFKSVQIDVDYPINRCVPTEQNRAQSNVLKQFYASCGIYKADGLDGKVGTFRLAFANYGGIQYCDADPDCTNDGNQWNRDGEVTGDPAVKRELTHDTRAQRHYMTRRGQNIFVPDGAKVGDIVWTPKSYSEDLEFDMDEIVGTANATVV